ncbi:MurR/RpiR family transcriptional regulator [Nesterenkonia halobia]|uniref:SIS domain-containing protein n=1 Tax=Nesterenkonia halobia TaxID=37922 RepID=A0ABP6RFX6_9MICC
MGETVISWIDRLVTGRSPSPATERVVAELRAAPDQCAFRTAQQVADVVGVNVATVTRTAQFLGFSGWPAFVLDYRGQYLATLTADRMLSSSGRQDDAVRGAGSVLRDMRALGALAEVLDERSIDRGAELIRTARRGVVLATGSFAGPATQLSHGAQLLGCDLMLHVGAASSQMTAVRSLGPGDVVVSFNIWKTAEVVNQLALLAADRGAALIVVGDRTTPVTQRADVSITVPSESAGSLPSTVPAVSVVQALLAGVADSDRATAEASLREVEALWRSMGIVAD